MKILTIKNRFLIFVYKVSTMKKIFIFSAFILTIASCQKEVFVPMHETSSMELKDEATTPNPVVTHNNTTTTTTSPTEPVVPTEDPGDITDPMRKKDKKDS